MFSNTVDKLLDNPEFMNKVASKFPNAVNSRISSATGMTGDLDSDLRKVAYAIGSKAYFQKRERSLINSGLMALAEMNDE